MSTNLGKLVFNFGVNSSVGNFRESNQDSAYAGSNFLLVADGMGGHAGGDVASTITVTMLSPLDALAGKRRGWSKTRISSSEASYEFEQMTVKIYLAIQEAVKLNADLSGMGTTVTAIMRSEDSFVTAHLGDSRAYRLTDGVLSRLTQDHTFVQTLVDSGKISEEDARHHPQKNVVTRVLGDFEVDLQPDISNIEIKEGDRYFLCSDGVCGSLDDDQIQTVLLTVTDPTDAANKLVEMALAAGSTDNCTAVVADVVEQKSRHLPAPVFGGAARESLQEHLNEIIEQSKKFK